MSRRIANLAFAAALAFTVTAGLSGAAKAGPNSVCGNSVIEPPETCDDGNTTSGDGCSGVSCKAEVCGDNILNPDPAPGPAEECDEGGKCTDGTTNCVVGANPDPACANIGDGSCAPEVTAACDANCKSLAPPEPMNSDQQKCANNANKGAATVVKAQNKTNSSCLGDASNFNACLTAGTNDPTSPVGKAKEKSNKLRAAGCTAVDPQPPFAYEGNGVEVNQAMIDASVALAQADLFGSPAAIADKKADKDGAGCQSAIQKDTAKAFDTIWSEVNKTKKKSLKGSKSDPGATSNSEFVADLLAGLGASKSIPKAFSKILTDAGSKCPQADVAPLFKGACTGGQATQAGDFAACGQRQVVCRACESLNAADNTEIDCDALVKAVLKDPKAMCLVDNGG